VGCEAIFKDENSFHPLSFYLKMVERGQNDEKS
jgi:hypothetical protein